MDDLTSFGIGTGLGGLGGGLAGMLFNAPNPYDKASKFYDQIPDTIKKYFEPYMQQGQRAGGQLEGQYGQLTGLGGNLMNQYGSLMNNPSDIMNKIGGGYQQSPGYKFQLDQAMNAANNAAAAGGMAGSPQHQQQASTMASGLANQDYWNYLNHGLNMYGAGLQGQQGLYGAGLEGLGNMYNRGFQGSSELGNSLANSLATQGNLSYAGQASQNKSRGDLFGNLIGGAASIFGL